MGRTFTHRSSAKAVIFTHDSPNMGGSLTFDVTPYIHRCTVSKAMKNPGQWNLTLSPANDALPENEAASGPDQAPFDWIRFVQPNDMVHIYMSNGTEYSTDSPSGGFHKQVIGYVDTVTRRREVDARGNKRTYFNISGQDHTKAWAQSNIHFNPYLSTEEDFGLSIRGSKLKFLGWPVQGTPADVVLFFAVVNVLLGAQFELPASYISSMNPSYWDANRNAVAVHVGHTVLNKLNKKKLTVPEAISIVTLLFNNLDAYEVDATTNRQKVRTKLEADGRLHMSHLLDLSYVEELYIRGVKFLETFASSGNVYSLIHTFSNPLLNECFFDLRLANRYKDGVYRGPDDLNLNDGAPIYTPALVLREYPFSTGKPAPGLEKSFIDGHKLDLSRIPFEFAENKLRDSNLRKAVSRKDAESIEDDVFVTPSTAEEDLNWLLRIMYFEARGGNDAELEAVAWVVKNRVDHLFGSTDRYFPDTYKGVATATGSRNWTTSDAYKQLINSPINVRSSWAHSTNSRIKTKPIDIALKVYNAARSEFDPTSGSLFFVSPGGLRNFMYFEDSAVIEIRQKPRPGTVINGVEVRPWTAAEIEERRQAVRKYKDDVWRRRVGAQTPGTETRTGLFADIPNRSDNTVTIATALTTPELGRFHFTVREAKIHAHGIMIPESQTGAEVDARLMGGSREKFFPHEIPGISANSYTFYRLENIYNLVDNPQSASYDISLGFTDINQQTEAEPSNYAVDKAEEEKKADAIPDKKFVDLGKGVFFTERNSTTTAPPTTYTYKGGLADIVKGKKALSFISSSAKRLAALEQEKGANRRFVDSVQVSTDEVIQEEVGRSDVTHINFTQLYAKLGQGSAYAPFSYKDFLPIIDEYGIRRNGLRVKESYSEWFEFIALDKFSNLPSIVLELAVLVDQFYQHNVTYLSGTLQLRGRPDIRVGYRLDYDTRSSANPDGMDLSFYVEAVTQEFIISQDTGVPRYTTVVKLSHGQPFSEDDRLPYVPPIWYWKYNSKHEKTPYLLRDALLSQYQHRTTSRLLGSISRDPSKWAEQRGAS